MCAHARPARSRALKTPFSNRDIYRRSISSGLVCWSAAYKETELYICADKAYKDTSYAAIVALRTILDQYIGRHAAFATSFVPLQPLADAPSVAVKMCRAAQAAGVGPMAAVAGAFAAHVGNELLKTTTQVIIENGGDVFMKTNKPRTVAVYAGDSPASMKIGIVVDTKDEPVAICTSSGRIGHSKSFGKADAAVVISADACLADACATRLGNDIKDEGDIQSALDAIAGIGGVIGAVAVMGEVCGAVGNIELKALRA